MFDVMVIGAGPAGMVAAQQAARLGAKTAVVTRDYVGGMATTDGPVPVRTLAHAARLVREAQQAPRYGIAAMDPLVDYASLLRRVRQVVMEVYNEVGFRHELERLGVTIYEHAGAARFVDPTTLLTASGDLLQAQKFIICAGGHNRTLPIPGIEYTVTHSDAWSLPHIPRSMIIVGSGATGAQVASIFEAFGTQISLFEIAPRILMTEDADVSTAVRRAFLERGMEITEGFEAIDRFEKTRGGVLMTYRHRGETRHKEAELVVMAVGWQANAEELNLEAAGVLLDQRGFISVDEYMQTSAPHIFAAGDINGKMMLVSTSSIEGYYAASNAIEGLKYPVHYDLIPMGSFTDPEYAQIGLTEERARAQFGENIVVATVPFDQYPRSIIDGRTTGFCKMIAHARTHKILGCHVVGERAVETVQLVAAGMKAGLTVEGLADLPLSFPTYVAIVSWAAFDIVEQLGLDTGVPRWLRA